MTIDPSDPGQPIRPGPRRPPPESPGVIEDYVRQFSLHHGQDFQKAQRVRGIMREFLVLGFLAETGLTPLETMLLERRDGEQTFWSYHPVTPQDSLAKAEIKTMRGKIAALEHELEAARHEIAFLKARTPR